MCQACLSALHMAIKNEYHNFKPGSNSRTTCHSNDTTMIVLTDLLKTGATRVIIKPSPWTKTFDKKKKQTLIN